jgi:hypothetical protein
VQNLKKPNSKAIISDFESQPGGYHRFKELEIQVAELESVVDQQKLQYQTLAQEKIQGERNLAEKVIERDSIIISLQKQLQEYVLQKNEIATSEKVMELEAQIHQKATLIRSLESKLEISEETRKAVHISTLSILRHAQEESSKLALSHHETSLEMVRKELEQEISVKTKESFLHKEIQLQDKIVSLEKQVRELLYSSNTGSKEELEELLLQKFEQQEKLLEQENRIAGLERQLEQLQESYERSKKGLPPAAHQFELFSLKIQKLEDEARHRENQLQALLGTKNDDQKTKKLMLLLNEKDKSIAKFQQELEFLVIGIQQLKT